MQTPGDVSDYDVIEADILAVRERFRGARSLRLVERGATWCAGSAGIKCRHVHRTARRRRRPLAVGRFLV
jgi:hypothetical protein